MAVPPLNSRAAAAPPCCGAATPAWVNSNPSTTNANERWVLITYSWAEWSGSTERVFGTGHGYGFSSILQIYDVEHTMPLRFCRVSREIALKRLGAKIVALGCARRATGVGRFGLSTPARAMEHPIRSLGQDNRPVARPFRDRGRIDVQMLGDHLGRRTSEPIG